MKKWFKRLLGIDILEADLAIAKEALVQAEIDKSILAEANKDPKKLATDANEPYIEITKVDLDVDNPSYGSFELDWNEFFVKKLRSMGYPGDTDEVVVDLWFQSVCRNILMETYEQDAANRSDNIRYINRKDLGDGKTEVS